MAAARALDWYSRDPNFRLLYDCTADVFADLLTEDMRKLADGKLNELSLAAKRCPLIDCCNDRSTLLCEAIGRCVFPRGSSPELPEDLDDRYYAYRVREFLCASRRSRPSVPPTSSQRFSSPTARGWTWCTRTSPPWRCTTNGRSSSSMTMSTSSLQPVP